MMEAKAKLVLKSFFMWNPSMNNTKLVIHA